MLSKEKESVIENQLIAMSRSVQSITDQDLVLLQREYQEALTRISLSEKKLETEKKEMEEILGNLNTEYDLNRHLAESAYLGCITGNLEPIQKVFQAGGKTWQLFLKLFPLNYAIEENHVEIVSFLLEKGVDCFSPGPGNLSAYAIVLSWSFRPSLSLEQQKIYNFFQAKILQDFNDFFLKEYLDLFYEILTFMSKEAANIILNSPISSENGLTPIMLLAKDNQLKYLCLLNKDFSIDFEKQDIMKQSAFDHAFCWGHRELCEWILNQSSRGLTPLEKACKEGDKALVMNLLQTGVDVGERENSAIIWAAMYGRHSIIFNLAFRKNVNMNARNGAPIIAASNNGHYYAVSALRLMGASIYVRNELALSIAEKKNYVEIVDYLREKSRLDKIPIVFDFKSIKTQSKWEGHLGNFIFKK